jgi:hypothetical protein
MANLLSDTLEHQLRTQQTTGVRRKAIARVLGKNTRVQKIANRGMRKDERWYKSATT